MTETARTWYLLRIAVVIAGLIILFFSGLIPVENYLALVSPTELTASVIPADVASLTNQNRIENGLPALSVNPLLTQAAQLKADDMATNSYYAHISPDGKSPLYWLQAVGYKYLNAGENLVIDRNTSEEAVDAWMNSPDHRENILRPQFTEVGIGVASGVYQGIPTTYVVEEFGTPYPLSAPAVRKIVPPPVVQATTPTKPVLVTDVQALVTPILKSIAPTVSTKPASVPVTTASPAPVVHPVSKPAVAMASHSTSTVTHSTQPVAQATSSMPAPLAVTTSSSTPFNYTLAPEFFTPVSFADTRSQTILASEETVPATHNPTPTWYISFSLFLSRIANFVPRIW